MAVRFTRTGVALTVGIIVLALATFGGLYFVQYQGEQARQAEQIRIAQQQLEQDSEAAVVPNDENDAESTDSPANTNNETPSTDTEAENYQAGSGNATGSGSESNQSAAQELPQTGTASNLAAVFVVAALTYVTALYVQSRKEAIF